MKLSESWLREWVNPALNTEALVEQITMAGLEVDSVEAVAGEFSGVVVGEITAIEPHPDAEKLRVCQVQGHPNGPVQVVCGAPNARAGIKVPLAMVGAVLPGDFKIKQAKLRGVESAGMLCAQTELQAGDDDSGLWELPADAPTGRDLVEYLSLRDNLIEVDLTPNRSDCLSVRGLARDIGVLNRIPVTAPAMEPVQGTIVDTFPVSLEATAACPRYCGRVIRNVDLSQPSPLWLQEKLRRSGIRSIDAVVDVTNYVMLELGQPLHAFDLETLDRGIRVRMAQPGENIKLLDGQQLELNDDTLVIADHTRALALAGIMGGEGSGVSAQTQHIFLESAFFQPLALAGRARAYGLHTDSSHRFERGVDYNLAPLAIERATRLLLDIVGGEAGPVTTAEVPEQIPAPHQVKLRRQRIESGLGLTLADEDVLEILTRLGLELLDQALRVVRGRRLDHLQTRRVQEERLRIERVERSAADAAAYRDFADRWESAAERARPLMLQPPDRERWLERSALNIAGSGLPMTSAGTGVAQIRTSAAKAALSRTSSARRTGRSRVNQTSGRGRSAEVTRPVSRATSRARA